MLELLGKWYTKMPVMPPFSSNGASTMVPQGNNPSKYLKPSYFSGTLILAILCRQGFSVFLF